MSVIDIWGQGLSLARRLMVVQYFTHTPNFYIHPCPFTAATNILICLICPKLMLLIKILHFLYIFLIVYTDLTELKWTLPILLSFFVQFCFLFMIWRRLGRWTHLYFLPLSRNEAKLFMDTDVGVCTERSCFLSLSRNTMKLQVTDPFSWKLSLSWKHVSQLKKSSLSSLSFTGLWKWSYFNNKCL